jgi:hypothetical protein
MTFPGFESEAHEIQKREQYTIYGKAYESVLRLIDEDENMD